MASNDTESAEPAASGGLTREQMLWRRVREKLIVAKKGSYTLVLVTLEKTASQGDHASFGIEKKVRRMGKDTPGLVIWEEINTGLLNLYNLTAGLGKRVKQYSIVTEVNGKASVERMAAELHSSEKVTMKIQVPHAQHLSDVVNLSNQTAKMRLNVGRDSARSAASGDKDGAACVVTDRVKASLRRSVSRRESLPQLPEHLTAADETPDEQAAIQEFVSDPRNLVAMSTMLSQRWSERDDPNNGGGSSSVRGFMREMAAAKVEMVTGQATGLCTSCLGRSKPAALPDTAS